MSKQSSARHAHLSELHIRISGDCGDQDVNEIQAEVQALFRRTLRGSLHLHKLLVSRSSITPWLGPILDDELTSVKTLIIHTTCHHDLESLPTLPRSQVTNISFRYHAPTIESESFPRFKTCLETHKDTVQYLHVAADIDTFPSKDVVFPCLRYLNLGILHARVPLEVLTKSCPNITHLTIRMTPHDLNARLEENLRIQDDPSCRWTQLGKLTSDIATLAGMGLVSQVNHVVVMGVLTRKKHFTWLYYVIKDNCPKSLSISLSSDPGDISLEPEVLGSFPHLKSLAVTVNVGQPYGTLLQFRIVSARFALFSRSKLRTLCALSQASFDFFASLPSCTSNFVWRPSKIRRIVGRRNFFAPFAI
ncbi:hypothetical protein OF83DRAFT_242992 [Amylostereum chailletii]|nr:hypothetical protein OF83DRAFT_242992 [Amylostereum chailletii]